MTPVKEEKHQWKLCPDVAVLASGERGSSEGKAEWQDSVL